eukprot:6524888-Pyramimonas_sp.AAC.1
MQQAPQAAEHQAMACVPSFVGRSGDRYSDCATVAKLCHTDPRHQASRKHLYGGMRRCALLHEKKGHSFNVVHAPAHRPQETLDSLPGPERRIGVGSKLADTLAKQALLLRPRAPNSQWVTVGEEI